MAAHEMPEPRTAFDWGVYSDATFAGLSVLIPIPLLDWLSEEYFRRRMPASISRYRGHRIPPQLAAELNRGSGSMLVTCLTLPFRVVWELVKRILGKLLYFLAIKAATDRLSYYWQRAFLIDYALSAGHLDDEQTVATSREAMDLVLRGAAGPFTELARQMTQGIRDALPVLRRAQQGEEDGVVREKRTQLARNWSEFEGYLRDLAARYGRVYTRLSEPAHLQGQ